jgi:DNA-binding NarL/FixJ family response regulator
MTSERHIRIVLGEAHAFLRSGLRLALEAEADFAVVGEAADGIELLVLVDRLRPCAVVADHRLPGRDGLTITRDIRARHPGIGVVLLTLHASRVLREAAEQAGAVALVLKDAGSRPLVGAVREACGQPGAA